MKKKTKLILTGTLCGGVTVGAISGGVAQIILDNQSELIDLENFDTKIGNDIKNDDGKITDFYDYKKENPLEKLATANVNSTSLNNIPLINFNNDKEIEKKSSFYNISFDYSTNKPIIIPEYIDTLSNPNGNVWTAQMDVFQEINTTHRGTVGFQSHKGNKTQLTNLIDSSNIQQKNIFDIETKFENSVPQIQYKKIDSISTDSLINKYNLEINNGIFNGVWNAIGSVLPSEKSTNFFNNSYELSSNIYDHENNLLENNKKISKIINGTDKYGVLNYQAPYNDGTVDIKLSEENINEFYSKHGRFYLWGVPFVNPETVGEKNLFGFETKNEYSSYRPVYWENPWLRTNKDFNIKEGLKREWLFNDILGGYETFQNWCKTQYQTNDSLMNELFNTGEQDNYAGNYKWWVNKLKKYIRNDINNNYLNQNKTKYFDLNNKTKYIWKKNNISDYTPSYYKDGKKTKMHFMTPITYFTNIDSDEGLFWKDIRTSFQLKVHNGNNPKNKTYEKINHNNSSRVDGWKKIEEKFLHTKYEDICNEIVSSKFDYSNDFNNLERFELLDIDFGKLFTLELNETSEKTRTDEKEYGKIFTNTQPSVKFSFNYDLMNALKEYRDISKKIIQFLDYEDKNSIFINDNTNYSWRGQFSKLINSVYNKQITYKQLYDFVESCKTKITEIPKQTLFNKTITERDRILKKYGWEFNVDESLKNNENNNFQKTIKQLNEIANWGFIYDYIIPLALTNNIYVDLEIDVIPTIECPSGKKEYKAVKVWDASTWKFNEIKYPNVDGSLQNKNENNLVKMRINNIWMGNDGYKKNWVQDGTTFAPQLITDEKQQIVKIGQNSVEGNQTLNLKNIYDTTTKQYDGTSYKANPFKNYNEKKSKNFTMLDDNTIEFEFLYNPTSYDFAEQSNGKRNLTSWDQSTTEMIDFEDLSKYNYYDKLKKKINTYLNIPTNYGNNENGSNERDWISGVMVFGDDKDLEKIDIFKSTSKAKESFEKFVNLSEKYKQIKKDYNNKIKTEQEFLDAKYELDELGYMYLKIQSSLNLEYFYQIENNKQYVEWIQDGTLIHMPKINNNTYEYLIRIENKKKPLKLDEKNMTNLLTFRETNWIKEEQEVNNIKDLISKQADLVVEYNNKKSDLKNSLIGRKGLYTEYRNLLKELNTQITNEIKSLDSNDPLIQKFKECDLKIEKKINEIKNKYKKFVDSKNNYQNNGIHQFVDVKLDLTNDNNELISLFDEYKKIFETVLKDKNYGLHDKPLVKEILGDLDKNKENSKFIFDKALELEQEAKNKIEKFNEIKMYISKWLVGTDENGKFVQAEKPLHDLKTYSFIFNFNAIKNSLKEKYGFNSYSVWWEEINTDLGQESIDENNKIENMFKNKNLVQKMFYVTNETFTNLLNKTLSKKGVSIENDLFNITDEEIENEYKNDLGSYSKIDLFKNNENNFIPVVNVNTFKKVYDGIKNNKNLRNNDNHETIITIVNKIKSMKISINKEIGKINDDDYVLLYGNELNEDDENKKIGLIEKYKNELDSKDWNWRPILVSEGIDKLIGELNDPKNRNFEYYNERLNVGIVAGIAVAGAVVLIGSIIGIVAIAKRKKHANFVGTGKEEDDIINKFNASNLI